jgi:hypothetical protein
MSKAQEPREANATADSVENEPPVTDSVESVIEESVCPPPPPDSGGATEGGLTPRIVELQAQVSRLLTEHVTCS